MTSEDIKYVVVVTVLMGTLAMVLGAQLTPHAHSVLDWASSMTVTAAP